MIALENALDNAHQHIDSSNEHFQSLMEETTQISQVMETISSIARAGGPNQPPCTKCCH